MIFMRLLLIALVTINVNAYAEDPYDYYDDRQFTQLKRCFGEMDSTQQEDYIKQLRKGVKFFYDESKGNLWTSVLAAPVCLRDGQLVCSKLFNGQPESNYNWTSPDYNHWRAIRNTDFFDEEFKMLRLRDEKMHFIISFEEGEYARTIITAFDPISKSLKDYYDLWYREPFLLKCVANER